MSTLAIDIVAGASTPDFTFDSGAEVKIEAATADQGRKATFEMLAYTGGPMNLKGFDLPVVVKISGIEAINRQRPILLSHDFDKRVGHSTGIDATGGDKLAVRGIVSAETAYATEVVESSKNGFPWQASIGASVISRRVLPAGRTEVVNGRTVTGPVIIADRTRLREVSFVSLGADEDTSAHIAAQSQQEETLMAFAEWLKSKGFDIAALSEPQKAVLEAAYNAELSAQNDPQDTLAAGSADDSTVEAKTEGVDIVAEQRALLAAETRRVAEIGKIAAKFPEIAAKAIEEGWNSDKTELAVLKASTPAATGPGIIVRSRSASTNAKVLEAAACAGAGLNDTTLEKSYDERTLDAASRFHGLSLLELMAEAAVAVGHNLTASDFKRGEREFVEAAFSNHELPTILGNVANKFMLEGYDSEDTTWRQIAKIRPVKDFKPVKGARLTASVEFEEIGQDGEIKHGTLGEETYTANAKTFAKMLGLTRKDLIDDDLSALTGAAKMLGMGAGQKLNTVFWTTFLANSAVFTSGRGNRLTGAGSALGFPGLAAAIKAGHALKDANGQLINIGFDKILVPPALELLAKQLFTASEVRDTTSSTKYATSNVYQNSYRPIMSKYIGTGSSITSGTSDTAWYLLGRNDLIEVLVLNGKQTPTIEQGQVDFNKLGIQMRGYFDFNVAFNDYRYGIANDGA